MDHSKASSPYIYGSAPSEVQQFVCALIFKIVVEKASLGLGSFTNDVPRACVSQAVELQIQALARPRHAYRVKYAMENITARLVIAPIVQRLEIDAASTL